MKALLLCLSLFLLSINSHAQTERAKELFVENIFNDFKSNELEYITENFVDSIYLENLLKRMFAKEPKAERLLEPNRIQDERKHAKKRLLLSLEKAYAKLNKASDGELGWASLTDIKLKQRADRTLNLFSAELKITLENNIESTLHIREIVYEEENDLFFIMSDKVRLIVNDNRAKDAIEATTIVETRADAAVDAAVDAVEAAAEAVGEAVIEVDEAAVEVADDRVDAAADATVESVADATVESVADAADVEIEEAIVETEEAEVEVEEVEVEIEEVEEVVAPPLRKVKKGEVYQFVEQMPEFPGGMKKMQEYLASNISYPRMARQSKIEGRVFIQFVVSKDGSLRDYKVLRGIGGGCEQEAIRVLKRMPKWKPGRQNGKLVPVMFTLPVMF